MSGDNGIELLKQLHEQYATNDNDKSKKVIVFISNLSFVLIGYGYTIWNFDSNKIVQLKAITIASCLVLTLLFFLSIHFGYTTRRDQFIIDRIRKTYLREDYDKLFKGQYNPKDKGMIGFLVSYYFWICVFLNIFIIGIYITSILVFQQNDKDHCCFCCALLINVLVNLGYYSYNYLKYFNINSKSRT